jgi:hypothetical protein
MAQNPHPVHLLQSVISATQYPMVFSFLLMEISFLGQYAVQTPHPLHRSLLRYAIEFAILLLSVLLEDAHIAE